MPTTKVLLYDLAEDLQQLLLDLIRLKGSFATLYDRLTNINSDLFDADTKAVINDLIQGLHDSGKSAIERIANIETQLSSFNNEEGNYTKTYEYDSYGNVVKEISSGDKNYTTDYIYKDAQNGILDYSEKKYTKSNGDQVLIKTTYTYDSSSTNIVQEEITTIITPASP